MKITKDGFIWKTVTENAFTLILMYELFELFSDSESKIENTQGIFDAIKRNNQIGIEVGKLPKPDNSHITEFLSELAADFTKRCFLGRNVKDIYADDGSGTGGTIYTDEAQEIFDHKWDEYEELLSKVLNINIDHS